MSGGQFTSFDDRLCVCGSGRKWKFCCKGKPVPGVAEDARALEAKIAEVRKNQAPKGTAVAKQETKEQGAS